ncbi:unnamed protein product [Meganyctiphanes norvegica]|uniref:Uncharacterized protein n=1 Tax=Meganyctiphanes norvegica TaxID=48144 RepID=A0AAV2QCL9_MEGNR
MELVHVRVKCPNGLGDKLLTGQSLYIPSTVPHCLEQTYNHLMLPTMWSTLFIIFMIIISLYFFLFPYDSIHFSHIIHFKMHQPMQIMLRLVFYSSCCLL